MKERPIIFSGEMVRAILDGHKTMTRRVVRPQPAPFTEHFNHATGKAEHSPAWFDNVAKRCKYGVPGDRLWVKETWASVEFVYDWEVTYCLDTVRDLHGQKPKGKSATYPSIPRDSKLVYRSEHHDCNDTAEERGFKWRRSIYMPRWASRITLEIVSIRVERLQDISEADAAKEGVRYGQGSYELEWMTPNQRAQQRLADFAVLWDSINAKKPGCSWGDNPWVWAIEFKRVDA